jgi:ADP-ribose pyrophosphatase YjhB (NUDIX family)
MARRTDYYHDPTAPKPNRIVPAVTAVVENAAGELLLHRRVDNELWGLPGGAVELGESVAQTVVREVKEETGLDVALTGLVGVYSDPHHVIAYADGEVRQQFSLCFAARLLGGMLAGSDESHEVRFVARLIWHTSRCTPPSGCGSSTISSGGPRRTSAKDYALPHE